MESELPKIRSLLPGPLVISELGLVLYHRQVGTVREITSLVQELIEDGTVELVCDEVHERESSDTFPHEDLCETPFVHPETKEETGKPIIEEALSSEKEDSPTEKEMESIIASKRANQLWEPKKKLENKAKSYVEKALADGCLCNNVQMKRYLWNEYKEDGTLVFKDRESTFSERTLHIAVKEVYRKLAPNKIYGTKGCSKLPQPCPLHPPQA